jgi:hypothetical protein
MLLRAARVGKLRGICLAFKIVSWIKLDQYTETAVGALQLEGKARQYSAERSRPAAASRRIAILSPLR